MNVLFAASEAVPYIKSGGLGDVIGDLPPAIAGNGHDVSIILPLYDNLQITKSQMKFMTHFQVPVAWRNQYCGLYQVTTNDNLVVYFIDNEHYFKRPLLYGYGDDIQRYAFFSRAVIEALPFLDDYPQIIHCHDWQTALIPVYLKEYYYQHRHIKTIITIHNLRYQGQCSIHDLEDTLGFHHSYQSHPAFSFDEDVNLLKAGLHYSDYVTTVSPTYADEIATPYFGERLDQDILHLKNMNLIQGVLNGIDYNRFPPAPDTDAKQLHKMQLQEQLGLEVNPDVPVVAIISRLVEQKGIDLICHVIREILALPIQLVVLGLGDSRYEELFKRMEEEYPHNCRSYITFNTELANKFYAGADLLLMPSKFEPCGLAQLIAMNQGCLPIVRKTGGLSDTVKSYDDYHSQANGFAFTNYNAHDMLTQVESAVRTFDNKELWHQLVENALGTQFTWDQSAKTYEDIYRNLIG